MNSTSVSAMTILPVLVLAVLPVAFAQADEAAGEPPPIAQIEVTARDYYEYAQAMYPEPILPNPKHGVYGPRHALSTLAAYHFTKDPQYAQALLAALDDYYAAMQKFVQENGGVHYSWEGPYLAGMILRELRQNQALPPEREAWAKEMLVFLAEHLSSWSPTLNYTRGSHHRAQGEACARALALFYYPDIPQAERWKPYCEAVWNDWWQFRDIGINDTGYFYGALQRVMLTADLMGREEVWQDAKMKEFWERLLYEVAPDGSTPPYGASSGWNSACGDRILALELAAKHTGDGRYRWAAHRIFNNLRARGEPLRAHNHVFATTVEPIALAAVLADDRIDPVMPDGASRVLFRKEITRLSNEEAEQQYPGWGTLDCNMGMTDKEMPHKIILRSGWEPNDLFMMVEAYTRHDPMNPTAILGLLRMGSTFACMTSEKVVSRENALQIEDPTGEATFCGQKGGQLPRQLPQGWRGMEATVEPFLDSPLATYARLNVSNYMGYRVEEAREFFFVKNRFCLVRDNAKFLESFPARLGPVWNTQRITASGKHWLNCYFENGPSLPPAYFLNPRWDLLVYHSPRDDRTLQVGERQEELVRYTAQYTTRYLWEGQPQENETVRFSWLLLPHDPGQDAQELADNVEFVRDEPDLVALRVRTEEGREEWLLLNESGRQVRLDWAGLLGRLATDARRLYLDFADEQVTRYWAQDATYLEVGGASQFREAERGDKTKGEKTP